MRIIIAAVVGGIILFAWGAVSWAALGWHQTNGYRLSNEAEVVAALQAGVSDAEAPGVYWIPAPADDTPEAMEDWATRHRAGPIGLLSYSPQGKEPMPPTVFAYGLGLSILAALVGAVLLSVARIGNYVGRLLFLVALGTLPAIAAEMMYWNYMHFPMDWTTIMVADHVISWFLAGLAMAAIVKRRRVVME